MASAGPAAGSRPAAAAIETAVIETGPAAPGELAPQRLTGPVQTHAGIPRRDARLLGEPPHADAVEVHTAKRRAVLGLEGGHEGSDAGAGAGLELLVGVGRFTLGFGGQSHEGTTSAGFPAVMVDDRISEHAVEPGRGRLGAFKTIGPADAADERILEDVFGVLTRAYASLEKAQEAGVVIQQEAEHIGDVRIAFGGLGRDGVGRAHGTAG